jgi:hypothetical protein
MPPAARPSTTSRERDLHRTQVNLVKASLRAGVQYERPGRVAKHQKAR